LLANRSIWAQVRFIATRPVAFIGDEIARCATATTTREQCSAPQLTRIMPRYYFDIRDGAASYPDKEGIELANRRATEIEAAM
jgi:hypothetical protein